MVVKNLWKLKQYNVKLQNKQKLVLSTDCSSSFYVILFLVIKNIDIILAQTIKSNIENFIFLR